MLQLFPTADDQPIDVRAAVAAEERRSPDGGAWLYTNMIASADGGTAVDGVSGQLGGAGDKAVFAALRSVADAILVGASTVREERYRPPTQSEAVVAERTGRGQAAHPRLAVVTRSLRLETDLPLFDDEANRPLILTAASAPAERRAELADRAEIVEAGDDGVDPAAAVAALAERGLTSILSEGGPSLNGQLIEAGLVDEWNLSLSPHLLGGDSRRTAVGPVSAGPPAGMQLRRVWTDDDFLFCRWVRQAATPSPS
ncbi:MAG: pyrimidine reductase family protein [Actinomycetota bacterium]